MSKASFLSLDSFVAFAEAHQGSYRTLSRGRPFTMEMDGENVVFRPRSGRRFNPELEKYIQRFNQDPSFRPSHYSGHLWCRSYFVTIAAAMLGSPGSDPAAEKAAVPDLEPPGPALEKKVSALMRKRSLRVPKGQAKPPKVVGTVEQFARDAAVKAWVLKNAKGRCELCREKAPFKDDKRMPFLELHHVHSLADGGPDTISNSVALCPNCHRACHHSRARRKLAPKLYRLCPRLVRKVPRRK